MVVANVFYYIKLGPLFSDPTFIIGLKVPQVGAESAEGEPKKKRIVYDNKKKKRQQQQSKCLDYYYT